MAHNVTYGSPPLKFLQKVETVLSAGAMTQRLAPQTRYMLWRNTASIMEDLI